MGIFKKAEKWISNAIPHQHSADRRAANEAVAEQINYYKEAKKEMEEENARVKNERETEKKRVAQKGIKAQRRAYRAPGFMDEASEGLSDTLG